MLTAPSLRSAGLHLLTVAAFAVPSIAQEAEGPRGWLSWRGPAQNGTSTETGLIDAPDLGPSGNVAWTYEMAGRGTPVIADGKLFGLGYDGQGDTLREVLFCLDAATGEEQWSHRFPDFLSDVIYTRYAIGAPTVDPETGHVYAMTGAGLLHAFTPEGGLLWQKSLTEDLGRLSFPNGRTGAPLLVDDLVVCHFIYAGWGPDFGPARDRFWAFDKRTGDVVWGATPGGPPKDSSFAMPIVEVRNGRVVLYAGLGGGYVCCIDALTGDHLWRFGLSKGGINSSALIHDDQLIVIHGKENRDTSVIGRMVGLDLAAKPDTGGDLPASAERWRNDLVAFTSSPVLVGDTAYATTLTGELNAVDVRTGKIAWHTKLGDSQLHASPLHADGKLYVPIADGSFHVIRPTDEGPEVLGSVNLGGSCLGAPAVAGGRVYVHSTERLYCFGKEGKEAPVWPKHQWAEDALPELGAPARLQVVPFDQTVRVGDPIRWGARLLDAHGRFIRMVNDSDARVVVAARQDLPLAERNDEGGWTAANPGAGVIRVTVGEDTVTGRVRVTQSMPYRDEFDGVTLDQGEGQWAFPPNHWLGGRMKWRFVELGGERVVTRNMDNPLFQRSMTLIGDSQDSNYTVQADVMSEGGRRTMSSVGVVNQRYLVVLKGNYQELEVSSNMEHLKQAVKFRWKAQTWYTMKTRVDMQDDGSAIVRAKVWPRDEAEPQDWTIEVTDPHGHTHGSPGIYGFTPQSRYTVYMDNLSVTPNDD